jgi:acyl-CoA synthetase (AMP-forming)/AMP-acid ligase II
MATSTGSGNALWAAIKGYGRILRAGRKLLPTSDWNGARLLEELARKTPEGCCIAFEDQRLSFATVDAQVNQLARELESRGVGPGEPVALLMDNCPEYLVALTAINRLRGVAALINTNITGDGLAHALRVAKAKYAILGSEHQDKLAAVRGDLEALDPERILVEGDGTPDHGFADLTSSSARHEGTPPPSKTPPVTGEAMCFIYTSGTTGLPKAAIITNQRWLLASNLFGRGIFEAGPGDVIYTALPLYHSNAMFAGWGAALNTGASMALRRKFSASHFWQDIRDFGATHFVYIGELCRYLLNQSPDPQDGTHSLRVISGNGLRPDIWNEFQTRFKIPLIREFYGATEGNAPIVNYLGRPGMLGRLGPGQVVVRCDVLTGDIERNAAGFCEAVPVGERGLFLGRINALSRFDGYVDGDATLKKIIENVFKEGDRYFNTGDLLEVHEDGWVAFADRIGDTFRWKGENVSTNEVAEALNAAAGVLETNVYGVEVPGADGRVGMASMVCSDTFDLDAFTAQVIAALPGYQRPYFLRIQRDMRITGTFKHQKVDYRSEGYDPSRVKDPLYFLDGERYVPLDAALYEKIAAGTTRLR